MTNLLQQICVEIKAIPEGGPFLAFVDHIAVSNNITVKSLFTTGPTTTETPPFTAPLIVGLSVESATILMRMAMTLLIFTITYAIIFAIIICV